MTDTKRAPGYPGALPPRNDLTARAWVATVAGILVLIFVLALVGIPSRLFPAATPIPLPSVPLPSITGGPSPSGAPLPSPSGS